MSDNPAKEYQWSNAQTATDNLKLRLGFLLQDCARLRKQFMDEVFKPLSVTQSQAWLLAFLSRGDGITQTNLADQMGLGKVAIGSLIDKLQANKMIERIADPTDRRVNKIYLTGLGTQVVSQMRKLSIDANDDMLLDITVTELQQVVETLSKLKSNLQNRNAHNQSSGD